MQLIDSATVPLYALRCLCSFFLYFNFSNRSRVATKFASSLLSFFGVSYEFLKSDLTPSLVTAKALWFDSKVVRLKTTQRRIQELAKGGGRSPRSIHLPFSPFPLSLPLHLRSRAP